MSVNNRYMLDTHIIHWYLLEPQKLPKNIYEMIWYSQGQFYASIFAVAEFSYLLQSGVVKLEKNSITNIYKILESKNIDVLQYESKDFYALENLPFLGKGDKHEHTDPWDRMIFSHAISRYCKLISADHKFGYYKKFRECLLPVG